MWQERGKNTDGRGHRCIWYDKKRGIMSSVSVQQESCLPGYCLCPPTLDCSLKAATSQMDQPPNPLLGNPAGQKWENGRVCLRAQMRMWDRRVQTKGGACRNCWWWWMCAVSQGCVLDSGHCRWRFQEQPEESFWRDLCCVREGSPRGLLFLKPSHSSNSQ